MTLFTGLALMIGGAFVQLIGATTAYGPHDVFIPCTVAAFLLWFGGMIVMVNGEANI